MRLFLLLFLTSSGLISAHAQMRIPIYKSAADSVTLQRLEQEIQRLLEPGSGAEPRHVDSLRQTFRMKFKDVVTGFRYIYTPDRTYTPIRDLIEGRVSPEDVNKLSISSYDGKKIPGAVYKCANLRALELVESKIVKLPRRLNRLRNLRTIAILNNHPKRRLKLGRNKVVNRLAIRGENPEELPASYHRFAVLDTLDLKRNNMVLFPRVRRNAKLRQLNLGENKLTLQERKIEVNPAVEHLVLQKNNITALPSVIGEFTGLKKLVLNYNSLSDLDPSLARLKNLEELGLYSNLLKKIPPVVYRLPELKFLDLYFNEIEKVDDSIASLKNLEILYLASNRIYSLSDKVGELQNLRELFIHHNRLSFLPPSIARLKKLEVLRVNANHLVMVPEWIGELANLRNLDISQNKIYQAPGPIRKLSHLELVVLTENAWENREEIARLADDLAERGVIVHLEDKL